MTRDRENKMLKASQIYPKHQQKVFVDGVLWGDRNPQNLWHDAQGEDLPEIDREVIVLYLKYPLEESEYTIGFAHRPNPDGVDGKSVTTEEIEHYIPKIYGKGGWNIPDVKWWLDLEIPKEE